MYENVSFVLIVNTRNIQYTRMRVLVYIITNL